MQIILTKIALKRELRRARRERDAERVDLITQALADDDILELVATGAEAEYSYERGDLAAGFDGGWKDFLEWLLENRERIIQFILTILSLFALGTAEEEVQ